MAAPQRCGGPHRKGRTSQGWGCPCLFILIKKKFLLDAFKLQSSISLSGAWAGSVIPPWAGLPRPQPPGLPPRVEVTPQVTCWSVSSSTRKGRFPRQGVWVGPDTAFLRASRAVDTEIQWHSGDSLRSEALKPAPGVLQSRAILPGLQTEVTPGVSPAGRFQSPRQCRGRAGLGLASCNVRTMGSFSSGTGQRARPAQRSPPRLVGSAGP